MELLGSAELCGLLRVNRQRLGQLTARSFPEPVARLSAGAVWHVDDIRRFAAQTGRVLHEDALASATPGTSDHELSTGTALAGTAETAALLGVSRQRVARLAEREGFPPPAARLTLGAVWLLDDVLAFARRTGRAVHLDALTSHRASRPRPGSPVSAP